MDGVFAWTADCTFALSVGNQHCGQLLIGKDIENRRRIFWNGLLYTLGRILSYALLGVVLILVLKEGSSMFGIQKTIGVWGELVLGPLLFLIGLFMLLGDRLNLPQFGFQGNAEGLARKGGWGALIIGALFALAFCPTSGVFYFGMLIPMSATATAGYLLPVVFAIATAIPVLVVAWILASVYSSWAIFTARCRRCRNG